MSLRILLADESTTIKKAFQLALGDLGAEIKSVPSGLDVVSVAQNFKPSMIFADVLLTKKSGYEVCHELREQAETKKTPVILMWSSFMEFNTPLAQQCGYTDKLEKPFDSESLRAIVEKYYKEVSVHPLKGLIDLPVLNETLPEFSEEFTPVQLKRETHVTRPTSQFEAPTAQRSTPSIHIETESYGDFEEVVLVQSGFEHDELEKNVSRQIKTYLENSPVGLSRLESTSSNRTPPKTSVPASVNLPPPASPAGSRYDESLMREEVRVMAEKICWQVIPEMAEKIIREELEKLLKNIEKSI